MFIYGASDFLCVFFVAFCIICHKISIEINKKQAFNYQFNLDKLLKM